MTRPDALVKQVSSGTSGRPVRSVRRSLADIASIHGIILSAWLELYPSPPERVALLGGISHEQVARKFQLAGTRFESFALEERARLREFDPQFLSTYPSIARELVEDPDFHVPSLMAFKLGGERIYRCDLEKIQRRFPGLPVIEQLGCTEMPAVAIGVYRRVDDRRRLVPQTHRFSFRRVAHDGWQPLIVRDDFPGVRPPFSDYYDTGDEVRWDGPHIVDIRRRGDLGHSYQAHAEALLGRGCVNVQFDLSRGELSYDGRATLPESMRFCDRTFRVIRKAPFRLPHSNKLPLCRSGVLS